MDFPKIVFAIPSLNEADNISHVVRFIDTGLSWYYPKAKSVILNVDNNSPDGTREAFFKTETKNQKVYISSAKKGKGRNIKNALLYSKKINADALAFIDGDVMSAGPEWVKRLLDPVLKRGYDHVLPLYRRNRFDGSITNHLVYPALYGFFNAPLRQPLAGEVAVSKKAIKTFLAERWPESAYLYGIDIFLVTESIFHNHRVAHTFLGRKAHKPSAPKLAKMFLQVAESLFLQIRRHKSDATRIRKNKKRIHVFFDQKQAGLEPPLRLDINYFLKTAVKEIKKNKKSISRVLKNAVINSELPVISPQEWASVVKRFAFSDKAPKQSDLFVLRALYFARFIDYHRSARRISFSSAEKLIQKQAKVFRETYSA